MGWSQDWHVVIPHESAKMRWHRPVNSDNFGYSRMMDNQQIALKLLLDAIGESSSIGSVEDRLRVQKAVYLAQISGMNLGYPYSWYVKGPYSPALTQDYYKLNNALASGDNSHLRLVLNPQLTATAPSVRQVLQAPPGLQIPKASWDEALASIHFLVHYSRYPVDKACGDVRQLKPHLSGIIDAAVLHLRKLGLLPN